MTKIEYLQNKECLDAVGASIGPGFKDDYLNLVDRNEAFYLMSIFKLFSMVKDIPGHIIELGVGAGRNAILFGRMLEFEGQDINARYIGFDTFGSYTPRDLEQHPKLDRNKWSQ